MIDHTMRLCVDGQPLGPDLRPKAAPQWLVIPRWSGETLVIDMRTIKRIEFRPGGELAAVEFYALLGAEQEGEQPQLIRLELGREGEK